MYLALYRKYRPASFDDVISQEHITTTLKNQIMSGQIAHAYLFTGTRGTGKTTCAKIMARAVNCLSPVNGNPCGECEACRAIAEGSTDIIEIDAASNNGVDSIRQIRDEVIYTPIDCKYKVYIIDEVHMLTGAAFNALLKTLEEPPAHVIFILATTEYYKVPATILSRCQQFLFSKIDTVLSAKRLLEIAEKEKINLAPAAAELIARLSDGAMRDALSLLDQCISVGKDIDEDTVRECSGAADSGYLFEISEAAMEKNPPRALEILDKLIEKSKDLSRFVEELTAHYRNLMLVKSGGESFVKASDKDIAVYKKQCGKYSLDEIMYHIDLISDSLDTINRMKQTGQARLLTEQLLIRLTTPKLSKDVSAFSARLGAVEQKIDNIQNGLIPVAVKSEKALETPEIKTESKSEKIENISEKALETPQTGTESKSESLVKPPEIKAEKVEKNQDSKAERAVKNQDSKPQKSGNGSSDIPLDYGDYELPPSPDTAPPEDWDMPPLPDTAPPEDWDTPHLPDFARDVPTGREVKSPAPKLKIGAADTMKAEKSPESQPKIEQAETAEITSAPAVVNTTKAEEPPVPQPKKDLAKEEKSPEKGEKSERKKAPKSEGYTAAAIGETDFELPENAPILPQWGEIVQCLPPAARGVLASSAAYLYDGKIYVRAGDAAATQLKRDSVGLKLRDAVTNVMGGRFEIYMLREKPKSEEQEEDKITPFLDRASAMGISVTVKN